MTPEHEGFAARVVAYFADSKLTPLVIVAAILLGLAAVVAIPREEEPQISVPMIDVMVSLPGASPREMEKRIASPMEQFIWEIPGVEYIYSTCSPGQVLTIVRFKVGQKTEDSLVKLQSKLQEHFDRIPPGAVGPLIKPRSIDDVPVLALTFTADGWDSYRLRQTAANVKDLLKQVPDVSETTLIGGEPRQINVELDLEQLEGRGLAPLDVAHMLSAANQKVRAGDYDTGSSDIVIEAGRFLRTADDAKAVVIGASAGAPIHLRDVARVYDGPGERTNYVEHATGEHSFVDAVTLAIAKRQGTNAIEVVDKVRSKLEVARRSGILPHEVQVTTTRDYGETSNEKANELLFHMGIAVVSVTILIGFVLGWREAGVVALAIPVTLALTLAMFQFIGFTLNRITLFALIFSIGILVDDPIVDVENIVRHFRMPWNRERNPLMVTIEAVNEVRSPLVLATFAVMAAILPMAFVRGLMGPYMRPIPIGASSAMFFSMVVAFVVTPWAAYRLLKDVGQHGTGGHEADSATTRLYRHFAWNLVSRPRFRGGFMATLVALLLAAVALVPLKLVKVKMLPFDNKSEFQVIINMDEGTSLEQTHEAARAMAAALRTIPEVRDLQLYAGASSPYNFNGLVRHYYLRGSRNQADLQVNLVGKKQRSRQSHVIAKEARAKLLPIAGHYRARIAVAEVPPGPPVLQTLVAEIYGPDYAKLIRTARQVKDILADTPGVVDTDIYTEAPQQQFNFLVDEEKAGIHGVSAADVAQALALANDGVITGLAHDPEAPEDVPVKVRVRQSQRHSVETLGGLRLHGADGALLDLETIAVRTSGRVQPSVYHKNLEPVVYVVADMAGSEESPVYAILKLNHALDQFVGPAGEPLQRYNVAQPSDTSVYAMKWDGEWQITYEVFRDLGMAFAVVLVLIYALVVGWFRSFVTPLVIMSAIPFSLVGILPAHWAGGVFFSATSMIGFIAGAGIVVRNSIILVDFINLRLDQGMPLEEAVVDAGAVRFRPMLLTALAVVIGTAVILLDPIFQGLAVALMAGEVASLLLSRMAVPLLYYLSLRRSHPRGAELGWAEPDWVELHQQFAEDAPED